LIRLQLSDRMSKCPDVWQKFIKYQQRHRLNNLEIGVPQHIIDEELAKFKAVWVEEDPYVVVDFRNEGCYNLFVLKYGA